jgi:maleylacetate reductase
VEVPAEGFVHDQLTQRIVFGWGWLGQLPEELDRLDAGRVLLVSESSVAKAAGRVADELGARVRAHIAKVRTHVPLEDVHTARALARDKGVDVVVTIGGGSATGLAKAVAVDGPSVVAVPTTYAGSEVTPIYGITTAGRKETRRDARVLPRVVIYDPELTTSLSPRITATSGLNALAHCVEALYARSPSPMSRLLAEEGIGALAGSLPRAVEDPTHRGARSGALYGAYLAGVVLAATEMALHHRICHVLGGTFGLAHGDANAVVLPHVVAFNAPAAPGAVARVAAAMGRASAADGVWEFARELGAPASLRELGFDERALERAGALVAEGGHYNPRPVARGDVVAILSAAFDGARPVERTDAAS